MQIEAVHSHLNGLEWLEVQKPGYWQQIRNCIESVNCEECRTKECKERGREKQLVFSPKDLNKAFTDQFKPFGWKKSKLKSWVTDNAKLARQIVNLSPEEQKQEILGAGGTPMYSFKEIDFVKERVAIEVQLGKYAFIAHDLYVKHLTFFMSDLIDCGIEILPMKAMQRDMSSGPPYYEGALADLVRQGRGVPAVPLILVGIAP